MSKLIEIERKRVVNISKLELEHILSNLGFELKYTTKEIDTYYTRPDVDYMKTVECLRVRKTQNKTELTYKPPSNSKTTTEHGIISKKETNLILKELESDTEARQFLDAIGMVELIIVDKIRHSYTSNDYDNLIVSIDIVKNAGIFVETEIISVNSKKAIEIINRVEKYLGFDKFELAKLPYRDLCMINSK